MWGLCENSEPQIPLKFCSSLNQFNQMKLLQHGCQSRIHIPHIPIYCWWNPHDIAWDSHWAGWFNPNSSSYRSPFFLLTISVEIAGEIQIFMGQAWSSHSFPNKPPFSLKSNVSWSKPCAFFMVIWPPENHTQIAPRTCRSCQGVADGLTGGTLGLDRNNI